MLEGGSLQSAIPTINAEFDGVLFVNDEWIQGDAAWMVTHFEGKSTAIHFVRVGSNISKPVIEQITLRPAPTMTYLNPRPAAGALSYPWRWNGSSVGHVIKLPIQLAYSELVEGSQIVVSGVSDALAVIEGEVENNLITYRAGGLVIAVVMRYEGTSDLVTLVIMEDFTGEILAVNFDKAYKNVSFNEGLDVDGNDILSYLSSEGQVAKCTLNGVVISADPSFIPSNSLLGNLVFQSKYVRDYGDVIEAYYWTNGRYLYVLRVSEEYKMDAVSIDDTNSPLDFPLI